MGFIDRLFGNEPQQRSNEKLPARDENEIALERYRYLLRTAPPETIEKAHAEAFEKLTPEQRQLLFTELSQNAPDSDAPRSADSASLASAATRSELRNPGTMERTMGNQGGMGFGSMVASSLLGTVAGYVIGSALVSTFLPSDSGNDSGDASGDGSGDFSGDANADGSAASADGAGYDGGGDFGGDF